MATLQGTNGNDVITGGIENDIINGLAGADTMKGGKGNDTYYVDNLGDTIVENAGEGVDTVVATVALSTAFTDVENYDFSKLTSGVNFTGNGLNNEIKGTSGIDTLAGGTGSDTYYLNSKQDVVVENVASGSDTIVTTFGADLADYANVENIRLLGSAALKATGNAGANVLEGNNGANILDGKGGADTMAGGKGNDTYYVDNIGDVVVEYAGEGTDTVISTVSHTLSANVEKLVLVAGSGAFQGRGNNLNNTIIGNESDNFLDGLAGADTMIGGKGNDAYVIDHVGDKIVENAGEGTDDVVYSYIDFSLASHVNIEHLILQGNAVKATGNAQNNRLYGTDQNNVLTGGAGADTMYGGKGNDTYYVDNIGDVVFEEADEGIDTVISTVAFFNAITNVENYDFSKLKGGVDFTGNDLDNIIKGGAGTDTLTGGLGNDTYYLNSKFDYANESANGGNDTIATTFSANLADYMHIENIRLLGSAALNATGNAVANRLEGNSGANVLDGKGGADTMAGGKGNDTYYVDSIGDIVVEYADEGIDTVISSVNHSLAGHVENLILAAGAGNIYGSGNNLNNVITGNEGNNIINGGTGADTMKGGKGDDTYYVDHVGDRVIENANEGDNDTVYSYIDFSLAALANVEHLQLLGTAIKGTGNTGNNFIFGNDHDNVIDGGKGADQMEGGKGNDTYYVDNAGDVIFESVGAGTDTVISTFAFSNAIANVENYDFSKLAVGVDFTGNDLDNVIKGGAGADTLIGGLGNDTYYLNSKLDYVSEAANGGNDTIATTFSAGLADYANIENIRLLGSAALNATGNAGANVLEGNNGANILDGKGGADTMAGGKGNDTYYVDHAGDVIVEYAGEGIDTVISSVNHSLAGHVENLILAAGAGNISGSGNNLNNVITGNEGNNTINGGTGADTMKGGKGDDTYYVDHVGDKIVENANEGTDRVISWVDFSLAALANVENLQLQGTAIKATGNALSNLIHGNDQDNIINGGAGADIMAGGKGNDTYYVDNVGDTVSEAAGEGIDTIISTIAFNNAIVNVENYDFSKLAVGINFAGNSLDNVIKGGAGVDTLTGGLGNDTYYLNSSKDVVVEDLAGGTDTIATTFNANLADYTNIENVRLLGSAGLKATGNIAANLLEGNSGANILDGKGGADTMKGGKGNDTYYVDNGGDLVEELANEGKDTVISSISYALTANVENLTLAGSGDLNGYGNALNNVIKGNDGDNTLSGGGGADTLIGGKGNDRYHVDHVGDKIVENANEGTDRVVSSISFSLASLVNVEELELTGSALNATGNARDNLIIGNNLGNVLDGGTGADTLIGGLGGDIYHVDNLGDTIIELAGEGFDIVKSTIALSNAYANVEHYDFSKAKSAVNFTGNDLHNIIWSSGFSDTLAGGKGSDTYYLNNAGDSIVELAGQGHDTAVVTFSVAKLWDNVEDLYYQDSASKSAWSATGNDLDNYIEGNAGNNKLDGGLGDDYLVGGAGNDTLTGGGGEDWFVFSASFGGPLVGHDVITDFDRDIDILNFDADDKDGSGTIDEQDYVAGIVDQGAGKDVVVHLLDGGSITFKSLGTGAVDSLTDLVADPSQIAFGIN